MHRLFVAVDPPPEVSERLHALRDETLDARWMESGNHHLTLKFIGNVDAERRDVVAEALRDVAAPPALVALEALTVFPSWRRPSVLVVLAKHEKSLMRLQEDVEKVLQKARIEPESKPFSPHITIARIRRTVPEAVRSFVRIASMPSLPPFQANGFRLYESQTKPEGAVYTCLAEYPLEVTH
ncbi:MAG TPA: RNA 2',3'-cyclic phosphodiesterase [Rhodothermales bacterium]